MNSTVNNSPKKNEISMWMPLFSLAKRVGRRDEENLKLKQFLIWKSRLYISSMLHKSPQLNNFDSFIVFPLLSSLSLNNTNQSWKNDSQSVSSSSSWRRRLISLFYSYFSTEFLEFLLYTQHRWLSPHLIVLEKSKKHFCVPLLDINKIKKFHSFSDSVHVVTEPRDSL